MEYADSVTMNSREPLSPKRRKVLVAGAALAVGGCNENNSVVDVIAQEASNLAPIIDPMSFVGKGWARSSVNSTIFRKDALTSNAVYQYIAYYDDDAQVIVGQRLLGSDNWTTTAVGFSGRPEDAHNSICLMLDGDDYLHLAWDHHVDALHYSRSIAPDSVNFSTQESMIGLDEGEVTYPEFHSLTSGDLLFAYRDGRSGDGKLVVNRYLYGRKQWVRVQDNLLNGEGQRNAYWQLHVDKSDTVHLSWVWRESSDASTNHDIHYARSHNGAVDWVSEVNAPLILPITVSNTVPVWHVPQGENLINQTSLTVNSYGTPFIATYFRSEQQFTNIQIVFFDTDLAQWRSEQVSDRSSDFELGGTGSKSLPISRPLILFEDRLGQDWLHVIYRDAERGDQALHASSERRTGISSIWKHRILRGGSLDRWEPVFDSRLWQSKRILHIYVQRVGQLDREAAAQNYPPTDINVLEVSLLDKNGA